MLIMISVTSMFATMLVAFGIICAVRKHRTAGRTACIEQNSQRSQDLLTVSTSLGCPPLLNNSDQPLLTLTEKPSQLN